MNNIEDFTARLNELMYDETDCYDELKSHLKEEYPQGVDHTNLYVNTWDMTGENS